MSPEVEEKINKAMVALIVRIARLGKEVEKEKAVQRKKAAEKILKN